MNNFIRNFFQVFVVLLVSSCGTTGRIQLYYFDESKQNVEQNLKAIIIQDSIYSPPSKWNNYELGVDSIYDIFILFQSNPKEIYQLDFIGPVSEWEKSNCTLALVGVFDGAIWHFESDLNSKVQERIKKRFETEILAKMKFQYHKE